MGISENTCIEGDHKPEENEDASSSRFRFKRPQESDLLGQPHRIIRHPDMPKIIFKYLWEKIARQEEIFAYIKNLSFDGGYYWVYANVTASTDSNRHIVGYYSIRRKANPKALEIIKPLYESCFHWKKREASMLLRSI